MKNIELTMSFPKNSCTNLFKKFQTPNYSWKRVNSKRYLGRLVGPYMAQQKIWTRNEDELR